MVGVQDFAFMGGSMGVAVGEAFVAGVEAAIKRGVPYIAITAAGGARMQEGTLSLMQMPRATVALQRLRRAGLPYVVLLTDPTTGGVTASYAMLGDVQISEPNALIGFAGQRVDRKYDPRKAARRVPARRISARSRDDRHGGASQGAARDARPPDRLSRARKGGLIPPPDGRRENPCPTTRTVPIPPFRRSSTV